ncbi:hypothetical protein K469DRAFT_718756 [Zopfia rhizophila CBS 207.26]|uniref:Uncharacterized protein n=1 Tax=Zopfia rhizophila CBS 207.26 TaxID=1314779 RepID=A0A6A6EJ80_9PEZI|nr:hypothetical protein K469DRAFT_718756 [Zopfia rhizophila CBS 207.26]
MNCFLRPSGDGERDGYLACLLGVQKMHALLQVLRDKARLRYYGRSKELGFL